MSSSPMASRREKSVSDLGEVASFLMLARLSHGDDPDHILSLRVGDDVRFLVSAQIRPGGHRGSGHAIFEDREQVSVRRELADYFDEFEDYDPLYVKGYGILDLMAAWTYFASGAGSPAIEAPGVSS